MSARYGWIITRDHTDERDVEVLGPSTVSDDIAARLRKGEGRAFRMYDDDGELYYSGRIITSEPGTERDFAPLDQYGSPNAGATEIRYFINNAFRAI